MFMHLSPEQTEKLNFLFRVVQSLEDPDDTDQDQSTEHSDKSK
jgi:hypothetical protein